MIHELCGEYDYTILHYQDHIADNNKITYQNPLIIACSQMI